MTFIAVTVSLLFLVEAAFPLSSVPVVPAPLILSYHGRASAGLRGDGPGWGSRRRERLHALPGEQEHVVAWGNGRLGGVRRPFVVV